MSAPPTRLPFGANVALPLQLILLLLLGRCFYIQVVDGDYYTRMQTSKTASFKRLSGERGRIRSSDGVILAEDTPYWHVAIDPSAAGGKKSDKRELREARLSRLLNTAFGETDLVPKSDVRVLEREAVRRQGMGKQYYFVGRLHGIEAHDRFTLWQRSHSARRVFSLERRSRRTYPRGGLAAQIVGPRRSNHEYWGIERQMNYALEGRDGLRAVAVDGRRRALAPLEGHTIECQNGEDVVLTLDSRIQRELERTVARTKEKTRARSVAAVIVDPNTGAVLALESLPATGGTDEWTGKLTAKEEAERCAPQITQLAYEPGSTIKPLIVAEALMRGVPVGTIVKPHEGRSKLLTYHGGQRMMHDVSRKGPLDLRGTLIHSSNYGMANLGKRIGREAVQSCLERFSLGRHTGFELPEQRGYRPLKWRAGTTITVPYGYELVVTPIQIVRAFCAIANGGFEVTPHIVRSRGTVDCRKSRGREVLSPGVAAAVRKILGDAVQIGMELKGETPNRIQLAGKTGTAKKVGLDPTTGKRGYLKDYRASFIGFAPMDKPVYLMMMVVDEPQGEYYGSAVARPPVVETLTELLDPERERFAHLEEGDDLNPSDRAGDDRPGGALPERRNTNSHHGSAPHDAPVVRPAGIDRGGRHENGR